MSTGLFVKSAQSLYFMAFFTVYFYIQFYWFLLGLAYWCLRDCADYIYVLKLFVHVLRVDLQYQMNQFPRSVKTTA